ncbi:MAG: hypothetical protein ISS45_08555 [Candidatus Omnitrophica bacterium]|nr:hypothetical protein [Candidatus Omnitrophota bacterium]
MKTRDWLEKNKIFFETFAAISLSIMALLLSCTQSKIARHQLILSENPRILIEPSETVKGSIGEFELSIRNPSLAELYDIRIYEDYFVTMTLEDGSIKLARIGIFITKPNTTIQQLKPNKKESFMINFKSIIEDMEDFYRERKGLHMRIARLKIKYRRKLDGKEFIQTKAYIIGGHGDYLFDYDERGIRTPITLSFEDIKNILGAEN